MTWIGLFRRSTKHASSDGVNSICGLVRSPQNAGELVSGDEVRARAVCRQCALRIPALIRRQIDDISKRH